MLHGYGGPDTFSLEDVPEPDAGSGQVRVRVQAIGLNLMDIKTRSGAMKDQMPTSFPAILGSDIAGVVEQVGDGVEGLAVGDRVVGLVQGGAYAEFALARADQVMAIPEALDAEHAVTVPSAAEVSRRVIALLAPRRGETFVVNGAAGSVGSTAVQLLVRDGVTVIGTASEDNHDYLRGLGVTPTTYGDGVVERIRALAPDGVDAVFDVTGHDFIDAAISLRGGTERIVTIADFGAGKRGVTVSSGDSASITSAAFAPVLALAASGEFITEVGRTFAFQDIPAAHRFSEQGHLHGKIVIDGPDSD